MNIDSMPAEMAIWSTRNFKTIPAMFESRFVLFRRILLRETPFKMLEVFRFRHTFGGLLTFVTG